MLFRVCLNNNKEAAGLSTLKGLLGFLIDKSFLLIFFVDLVSTFFVVGVQRKKKGTSYVIKDKSTGGHCIFVFINIGGIQYFKNKNSICFYFVLLFKQKD